MPARHAEIERTAIFSSGRMKRQVRIILNLLIIGESITVTVKGSDS